MSVQQYSLNGEPITRITQPDGDDIVSTVSGTNRFGLQTEPTQLRGSTVLIASAGALDAQCGNWSILASGTVTVQSTGAATFVCSPGFAVQCAAGDVSFVCVGYDIVASGDIGIIGANVAISTEDLDIVASGDVAVAVSGAFEMVCTGAVIGGAAPTAKAVLELRSTTQAFYPPRMTTAQRDAMAMAAGDAGALIFNTTTAKHEGWDGAAWNAFY